MNHKMTLVSCHYLCRICHFCLSLCNYVRVRFSYTISYDVAYYTQDAL